MSKLTLPIVLSEARSEIEITGPTADNHPGELNNPQRPIIPLAIDYQGASIRSWHNHRRGQLLYAVHGVYAGRYNWHILDSCP